MTTATVILASASPRRTQLLSQLGVPHEVMSADICEEPQSHEHPLLYTQRLAMTKAEQVFNAVSGRLPVLGADTTVTLNMAILGKPANEEEAVQMLLALSGKTHEVITSIALVHPEGREVCSVVTEVEFAELSYDACQAYWRTGEPADKAGAYGIQGLGGVFVRQLRGSYSAVVGLPLFETAALLKRYQIHTWQTAL